MDYPYLAFQIIDEDLNVVFFTSENTGVVVLDETEKDGFRFGENHEFNEEDYTVLPHENNGEEVFIRLNN